MALIFAIYLVGLVSVTCTGLAFAFRKARPCKCLPHLPHYCRPQLPGARVADRCVANEVRKVRR